MRIREGQQARVCEHGADVVDILNDRLRLPPGQRVLVIAYVRDLPGTVVVVVLDGAYKHRSAEVDIADLV